MTEAEAFNLLKLNVPLLAEPEMTSSEYVSVLALYQVSDTDWSVLRASAHICRLKATRSAEMHARGADNVQEQQVFANWLRLAADFDKQADAEEATTARIELESSPYIGTIAVSNVAVW